eukprot:scaffold11248_cov145-Skeletonema_menzelii.AAC.6
MPYSNYDGSTSIYCMQRIVSLNLILGPILRNPEQGFAPERTQNFGPRTSFPRSSFFPDTFIPDTYLPTGFPLFTPPPTIPYLLSEKWEFHVSKTSSAVVSAHLLQVLSFA